jgi:hypothetical protein
MPPRAAARTADGYVLNVAAARRKILLDAAEEETSVAEVVPDFTHSRSYPLVCFASFDDGAITHIALGRRGHRAGTGLRRLNLRDLTKLSTRVAYEALLERIPRRVRVHVENRFDNGGLLPPGSFLAVVDAIRDMLPESNRILERFSARRQSEIADLSTNARQALAYQKETVATALAFAGIDAAELQDWRPRNELGRVQSFLDGLPQARLREDQMLINDLVTFPGFELVRTTQHAAAVFTNDRVSLTVVMANRNPLESQLGADLIYRNETYGAFVIVQYKAMEHESGMARFRLPNEQLTDELERMDQLWGELRDCTPDAGLGGFRLKENPFFLKLCPRIVFDPDDAGLVKGMYIPIEYWRRLEADPAIKGQRDGRAVTYDNVGRYLNNTAFAELVADGWIGTTAPQSEILDAVMRQILDSGRTVTIALKRDLTREEHLQRIEEIEAEDEDPYPSF